MLFAISVGAFCVLLYLVVYNALHHIAVFNVAVGQIANTAMTAQTDQILPIDNGGNFLPQDSLRLIWAYAGSATANRARIVSPAYRQVSLPYVRPLNLALLPPNNPAILNLSNNPLLVPAYDPLGADFTSDLAMATEQAFVVIALSQQYQPPPIGDIYTLRATGTTTLTARGWTDVPLTWDQPIVQGQYTIVGGDCIGTTVIAWRVICDGFYYRPGGLGFATLGLRGPAAQYVGGWGSWATFRNTSLPRLQVYANAADTAQTLNLQVVKTG